MIKRKFSILICFLILLGTPYSILAQDREAVGQNETFGASRISLTQSVEPTAKGQLIFDIQHQFGPINSGIQEFFGLDQATTRLGLSYGIFDWLTVGAGRSGLYKTYDGSLKARLISQKKMGVHPLQ